MAPRRAAANSLGFSKLACSRPEAERSTHGAERGAGLSIAASADAELIAVVEREAKGVAECGKRTLGGIRLGALECNLVRPTRGEAYAFSCT